MSAKKIIFATDYSPASQHALNYAASMARDRDATLLIVHVSELEEYPVGELFDEEPRPSESELEELLAVKIPDSRIHCEHRLLHGAAAKEIVKLARQEDAELIVMGARGRSPLGQLLVGSVAEAVIRDAHCAVCALRPPVYAPVA
ncbi:MAG TPA: universal stress protein [Pirellulales bacterium]|nr:universal stress protein [Pirellulales bacterium]